jgi:hypothetical protein
MPDLQVMRSRMMRCSFLLAACVAVALPAATQAADMRQTDVRQIRVGLPLDEKSAAGLKGFACAVPDAPAISGWSEYRQCPANAAGLREMRFEFEEDKQLAQFADRWEGTKIAGHPVVLTMAVTDTGTIDALRIVTDAEASPYLKKKAYLLSLRVREHYGMEGWACADLPRDPGEAEIGGMFVKQQCSKTIEGRSLKMLTKLFRGAGQDGKTYEDSVSVEVTRASAS